MKDLNVFKIEELQQLLEIRKWAQERLAVDGVCHNYDGRLLLQRNNKDLKYKIISKFCEGSHYGI